MYLLSWIILPTVQRKIIKIITGVKTSDGAGFPPHPHRGFETITYMLNGKWQHQDSAGNEGLLGEGSV